MVSFFVCKGADVLKSCRNRGKFKGRMGRPKKTDYEKLKKERRISFAAADLLAMRDVSIESLDPENVADISSITLSDSPDDTEWLKVLIGQTGNPFFIRINGVITKVFH